MTQNNDFYISGKYLVIPDMVTREDIPTIYHYFDYYNIAKVKNVEVYYHVEEEYYVEDKSYYGYAVIEIEEWYNNNGSVSFYNHLWHNKCKMVYDDPNYWNVEFYENGFVNIQDYLEQESSGVMSTHDNIEEETICMKVEVEVEEEEEEEEDDPEDPDYTPYNNSDNDMENKLYEFAHKFYATYDGYKTRSKTVKRKQAVLALEDIIVKKNKKQKESNKRIVHTNTWSRRLRQKKA